MITPQAAAPAEASRMMLMDRLLKAASHDLGTVPGKIHFVLTMAKHIEKIADTTERNLYIWRVAEISGLPADTIHRQVAAR